MTAFSVSNLVLNILLGVGLKYLLNMVNLLQFIIFMRAWLIGIPDFTDQWLLSLKTLALFEFLPTDVIKEWFLSLVNKDTEGSFEGEKTTFDELMVFILGGSALLLLILLLIGCKLLAKVCDKCRKCTESLKRKLLYGSFIRYILLGTLKL